MSLIGQNQDIVLRYKTLSSLTFTHLGCQDQIESDESYR